VIVPRRARDGTLFQKFGDHNAMVLDFIEADPAGELTKPQIEGAARALASLHQALPASVATTEAYRLRESLDFWLGDLASLPSRFSEDAGLRERLAALAPRIGPARSLVEQDPTIPWIHCHGDVTPRNVMFVRGNALFYDFQAALYAPRITDIAEGALEFAFQNQGACIQRGSCDTFLSAYEAVCPLVPAEKDLLPTMMFLHAAVKLGRLMRMQVVFGNKVNMKLVMAFLAYAESSSG
jgi:Ser/Thr protein kinase RdoA (MazF antagonist)